VTLDQYKYASSIQTPQVISDISKAYAPSHSDSARLRSQSLSCGDDPGVLRIKDRLKHTVDFQVKGMKPNTRGDFIQEPLATLKDLFHKLPETIGFNIEISELFRLCKFSSQRTRS
jgi:glycerophosphodiester phosphodiesterase